MQQKYLLTDRNQVEVVVLTINLTLDPNSDSLNDYSVKRSE